MDQYIQFVIKYWYLWLLFMVLLALIIQLELSPNMGGIPLLTSQQATLKMNREDAVVVDVRDRGEYEAGHITDAISLPSGEFEDKLKKLQKHKSKPIIVYCAKGQNASKYAAILKKNGFDDVFCLKGGVSHWQEEHLPLVKG